MVVLGGWTFSYERGTPELPLLRRPTQRRSRGICFLRRIRGVRDPMPARPGPARLGMTLEPLLPARLGMTLQPLLYLLVVLERRDVDRGVWRHGPHDHLRFENRYTRRTNGRYTLHN